MRDEDGFLIRCKDTEWRIIDARDNHDYVCLRYGDKLSGYHLCYGDEKCKYYRPNIDDEYPLGYCPHQE